MSAGPFAELAALAEELGLPDVAAVCTTHERFAPCGGEGCAMSEDGSDVAAVMKAQRGE